jgi:hypothetical protein
MTSFEQIFNKRKIAGWIVTQGRAQVKPRGKA